MSDDRSIPSYLFDFEKNKKKGIFTLPREAWGTSDTFIMPFFYIVQWTLELIILLITYWNEMNAKDHRPSDEECRSLANVSGAVLEGQQGNEISRDLCHRREEAVQIRVAVQVWGVENQSVVADDDDGPAHIQNNRLNTCVHTESSSEQSVICESTLKKNLNLPQKGAE